MKVKVGGRLGKNLNDYNEKYREIGRRVAFYRKMKGLSQGALAEKVNFSKSYISKIEAPRSETSYSLDVLFSIAAVFDIDVALFFLPADERNISQRE